MKLDLVDSEGALQPVQKGLPVGVIAEDRFALVAARQVT
jgi:hypothetical protein